jgi:dienelactone hydrolase
VATLLLFHHAQGLTPGCLAFAATVRAGGHVVHTPDLYDGKTFPTLAEGVSYAEQVGFSTILARGQRAAEALPHATAYAGFSLGVLPAQMLAQRRPGATGALLFHACVPPAECGAWPSAVPLQVHMMDADPVALRDGDLAAARDLVATAADATLFLYRGDHHLFADASLPDYDDRAATLLMQRVLVFLDAIT